MMKKPNLLFPTPVWTMELENFKSVNEDMYNYIKNEQASDSNGINKAIHQKDDLDHSEPKKFIKLNVIH